MKILLLAAVFCAGLYFLGYGPDDLNRAANDLANANAAGISPSGRGDNDWGTNQ